MIERDLQHGISAHRQADKVRLRDLQMIENRDRIPHDMAIAICVGIVRNIGRLVPSGIIGDAAITLAERAQLRLPAAMIAREFVHEKDRSALPHLFVVKVHFVGRQCIRHRSSFLLNHVRRP